MAAISNIQNDRYQVKLYLLIDSAFKIKMIIWKTTFSENNTKEHDDDDDNKKEEKEEEGEDQTKIRYTKIEKYMSH